MRARGGVLGVVDIVDCVSDSPSAWFDGPLAERGRANYGFVLRNARVVPFRPMLGRLRFLKVSDSNNSLL